MAATGQRKAAALQFEADYDASQAELLRLAHDEEERHQAHVSRNYKILEADHLAMRAEERGRIKQSRADAFGSISAGGYLDGFGKSAR